MPDDMCGSPIVCHTCWPTRKNWNEPCPCVQRTLAVHRRELLRVAWAERQYRWAERCLDEMGVPSMVVMPTDPTVPGMSLACRIQWLAWAIGAYGHEKIASLRKESDDEYEQYRKACEEMGASNA